MWIAAITSSYHLTRFDPFVNMLRVTTEAFSGAVGGADSLTVMPFDEALRPADEFSRRIAPTLNWCCETKPIWIRLWIRAVDRGT
jgi:methylmalonyl-CoA mutase